MRDAGISLPDRKAEGRSIGYCSLLFFLKDALDRVDVVSPNGMLAAVERLGHAHSSPATLSTHFGPRRWDGAASTLDFAYVEECSCFKYKGGAAAAP